MNRSNLEPDVRKKISLVLEREILPSEEGRNNSFSEFTESDLNELRLLEKVGGGILLVSYIKFRLKCEADLHTVIAFCAAMVQEGFSLAEWVGENRNH